MRMVITGGQGQLASDLVEALAGHEVVALGRDDLDITAPQQVTAALERWRPNVLINTAAFHQVDACEDQPERSFAVNAAAPQRLAAACQAGQALLVHFSTDYVFGGSRVEGYSEEDPVDPINVYGASKAAGEMVIRCTTNHHLIIRTTGLYGHGGRWSQRGNFVETMLRLAAAGKPISVVDDQVLTPSYTVDVAQTVVELLRRRARGTYHVTNGGCCSWYAFAVEIFRLADRPANLSRTTQAEHPARARRPAFSVLAHEGLRRLGIPEPRPWQEALRDYLAVRETSESSEGRRATR